MAKTKTRRKKSARRKRPSRRKQLAARNECCPIVRIKCGEVQLYRYEKRAIGSGPGWLSRMGTGKHTKRVRIPYTEKRCTIKLGNRTAGKGLTQAQANVKMGAIRKQLQDRRCQVIVQSEK